MPLDVLGRTRATMASTTSSSLLRQELGNLVKTGRIWDWGLQLCPMNEEFLVGAVHQTAPTKSLPFVHTARRYYRLNGLVRASDWRPRKGSHVLIGLP